MSCQWIKLHRLIKNKLPASLILSVLAAVVQLSSVFYKVSVDSTYWKLTSVSVGVSGLVDGKKT